MLILLLAQEVHEVYCTVDVATAHHHATMHRRMLFNRAAVAAAREGFDGFGGGCEQEFDENLYHMVQLPFNEQCDHVTCLTQQLYGWPLWSLWPFIIHAVSDYKKR